MPYALYVCLQDEDKIIAFTMEAATGQLTLQAEVPVAGGPSVLALSPDRQMLYVGQRGQPAISSFRIDHATGGLTPQGTVASPHAPTFLAPDRTGRYVLAAYYQGGYAAVHPLGADGVVGAPPCDTLATAMGAHAIQTDPSNQFAFVPHIARFNDNVLEPHGGVLSHSAIVGTTSKNCLSGVQCVTDAQRLEQATVRWNRDGCPPAEGDSL